MAGVSHVDVIEAAGGLVVDETPEGPKILAVHRPKYDDWTLPKGKLEEKQEPGDGGQRRRREAWQEAALREVREETGYTARIDRFAGVIWYETDRRPKVVLFWRMVPDGEPAARTAPEDEVNATAWLPLKTALRQLTHAKERTLVEHMFEPSGPPLPSARSVVWLRTLLGLEDHRRARLDSAIRAYAPELDRPAPPSGEPAGCAGWRTTAETQLAEARAAVRRGDVDAGWRYLHACQRTALCGLDELQVPVKAAALRAEASKIESWRGKAIGQLMDAVLAAAQADGAGIFRLQEATALRDEHFANQYFKIDLIRSQFKQLTWILVAALLVFMAVLFDLVPVGGDPVLVGSGAPGLAGKTLALAMSFGVVGAAFWAILSTAQLAPTGRIPERISGGAVALARAVLGAPAALVAVLLLQIGLLPVVKLDPQNQVLVLIVAFAAGFSERFVLSAVESVAGKSAA